MSGSGEVRVTAPVRVDLAGGTLDLWPLGLLHEGAVTVAVAIDLRVEVRVAPAAGGWTIVSHDLGCRRVIRDPGEPVDHGPLELVERIVRALAPDRPLRVALRSPVAAGSGLGTSSALGIATAAAVLAVRGRKIARRAVVALVRDLEAVVLGIPTGTQDHETALAGGACLLEQAPGGPRRRRIAGRVLRGLAPRLLVFDSGTARSSGPSNWDMFRRRIEREAAAVEALSRIRDAGRMAQEALVRSDWPELGCAMRADLAARSAWSPLVMTPRLEAITAAADAAGALGVKVCGAGGGGYGIALVEPSDRAGVAAAIRNAGGRPAEAQPTAEGLAISFRPER